MQLDQTRRDILAVSGHLLIQGGPGCGKTTIALLKAAMVLDELQPEQRVLFLSFSRAAVRQIAERMPSVVSPASRNRLEVRTFHSFFLELVRAHGPLLIGRPAVIIPPDRERQLRADFDGNWPREKHRMAEEDGRYVFDRLAGTAARLLSAYRPVRNLYSDTYPLIIVDEFQDTNEDQWAAVRALSKDSTIVCLADPDQRIFDGFIDGVDEKRIEHAIEHLAPTPFDLSGDNHRSPGSDLLGYANAVLRNDPNHPKPSNVITWPYSRPITCEAQVHRAILALSRALKQQLGRTPTIAVLAPTNALIGRISEAIGNDQPDPTNTAKVLPQIDHELNWDQELSAAAGSVVASIMEWPGLSGDQAITGTLNAIADFYRTKIASGTAGARTTVSTIANAITAAHSGVTVRSKAAKAIINAVNAGIELTGEPVSDWQMARRRLAGAKELEEIFSKARLLRLLRATDAIAWALMDTWNGQNAYTDATRAIRRVFANETLVGLC